MTTQREYIRLKSSLAEVRFLMLAARAEWKLSGGWLCHCQVKIRGNRIRNMEGIGFSTLLFCLEGS